MGERTHPWGAPEFSTTSSDRYPFTQTRCNRSRRKSPIHSTRFELTCQSISLFNSTYGSIVLNALEKSTNTILTYDLAFSKCCVIKFRRVTYVHRIPWSLLGTATGWTHTPFILTIAPRLVLLHPSPTPLALQPPNDFTPFRNEVRGTAYFNEWKFIYSA